MFRSIAAGPQYSCGVTTANAAYCWGGDEYLSRWGALGAGANQTSAPVPRAVSGPALSSVSVGLYSACGLTPAGAAWCWGRSEYGGIGNGKFGYSATPVQLVW